MDQGLGVTDMMPEIIEAKALPDHHLWLRFNDGSDGVLDLAFLKPFKGVFEPFEDHSKFEEVTVEPDWGTVYWPWGAELDALLLYARVKNVPVEFFLNEEALKAEQPPVEDGCVRLHADAQVQFCLEQVYENLWAARTDPTYWMCVIIFLYKALHDLMVLALRGTAGIGALKEKAAGQRLEAYEKLDDEAYDRGQVKFPKDDLALFFELYARIQDSEKMPKGFHSRHFVAGSRHDASIQALHKLRNRLMHTPPRDWIIETNRLQETCAGALDVAAFLVDDANTIMWSTNDVQEQLSGLIRDSLACLAEREVKATSASDVSEKVQAGRQ